MNHPREVMRSMEGHDWAAVEASTISFVCRRCGIPGYVPAKEREAGVKTSDECDHHVVETVLVL